MELINPNNFKNLLTNFYIGFRIKSKKSIGTEFALYSTGSKVQESVMAAEGTDSRIWSREFSLFTKMLRRKKMKRLLGFWKPILLTMLLVLPVSSMAQTVTLESVTT